MISASHVHTAHLRYDDLMAEVARGRLAAQARRAPAPPNVDAPRRVSTGIAAATVRRVIAALAAVTMVPDAR